MACARARACAAGPLMASRVFPLGSCSEVHRDRARVIHTLRQCIYQETNHTYMYLGTENVSCDPAPAGRAGEPAFAVGPAKPCRITLELNGHLTLGMAS